MFARLLFSLLQQQVPDGWDHGTSFGSVVSAESGIVQIVALMA